jgi:hypothetical protein
MPEAVINVDEAEKDVDDDESIDPDQLEEYREELQALGTFPVRGIIWNVVLSF